MRSEQHQIYSKDARFVEVSLKYKANRRVHTNNSSVTHKGIVGDPIVNPLTVASTVILFTIGIFI